MTRAQGELVAICLAIVAVVALVQCGREARGHGAAHWIQTNPLYVDINGMHCCGPADCRPDHESKFRETDEGIEIATGAGDWTLFPKSYRARGLYASIDDRWWICVRGGVVKCVFKPTSGS